MVEPRLRRQETGRDERDARLQPEPLCGAAPRPVLTLLYQAYGQGPSFDHCTAPDQGARRGERRHDHRETARAKRSRRIASGIPYPFNKRLEPIGSRRLDNQVPGFRQQRERQQSGFMPGQDFSQGPEQCPVVGRPLQTGMWLDEAADEVNVAGRGRVGHRGSPPEPVQTQARCQQECCRSGEECFE
jgi:hypothetical protein